MQPQCGLITNNIEWQYWQYPEWRADRNCWGKRGLGSYHQQPGRCCARYQDQGCRSARCPPRSRPAAGPASGPTSCCETAVLSTTQKQNDGNALSPSLSLFLAEMSSALVVVFHWIFIRHRTSFSNSWSCVSRSHQKKVGCVSVNIWVCTPQYLYPQSHRMNNNNDYYARRDE